MTAADDAITARVTVANIGARAGREVAQFYLGVPGSRVPRPPRVLAGFAAAELMPGESTELEVRLSRTELAYWDVATGDWVVERGEYRIDVGASSRDLRIGATVALSGVLRPVPLTLDSTLAEVAEQPEVLHRLLDVLTGAVPEWAGAASEQPGNIAAMMAGLPVGRLTAFVGGRLTRAQLQEALDG